MWWLMAASAFSRTSEKGMGYSGYRLVKKLTEQFGCEHFKGPKYTFKEVVLPGRVECGGTEGEIVVAHGCRKRKS